MPDLSWFPNVASGTPISAANAGFDGLLLGAASTAVYDDAHTIHGAVAGKFQTTTDPQAALQWTTQWGSQAAAFFSMYVYLDAYPAADQRFMNALLDTNLVVGLDISTTGILTQKYADFPTLTGASTATGFPLDQWVRLELDVTVSTTVGAIAVRVYSSPDSTTPSDSASATGLNMGTAAASVLRLPLDSVGQGPVWLAAVRVSSTAQPGPFLDPTPFYPISQHCSFH